MAEREGQRFDSMALEKVLKRAAELQTAERDMTGSLSGEEVLSLGRDVGIPERYLKQAMLEVSMTTPAPPNPETLLDELIGVAEVQASRVIRGDPAAIEEALLRYMDEEEVLRVLRRTTGHISWEPLRGWQGAVRRVSSRTLMLKEADRLVASLTPLEDGYVYVELGAGVRNNRLAYVGGGAAITSVGVAGSTILVALSAIWPLVVIPLPIALAISWGVMRQYRQVVERVQLGLEMALDHLEHSTRRTLPPPQRPGLVDTLIRELVPRTRKP